MFSGPESDLAVTRRESLRAGCAVVGTLSLAELGLTDETPRRQRPPSGRPV